jgi:hypothetical protein
MAVALGTTWSGVSRVSRGSRSRGEECFLMDFGRAGGDFPCLRARSESRTERNNKGMNMTCTLRDFPNFYQCSRLLILSAIRKV